MAIRPMGGGTALMMKAQIFKPVRLVSLRRIGEPFVGDSRKEHFKILPTEIAGVAINALAVLQTSKMECSPPTKMRSAVVIATAG